MTAAETYESDVYQHQAATSRGIGELTVGSAADERAWLLDVLVRLDGESVPPIRRIGIPVGISMAVHFPLRPRTM